ncbi:cell division ATP-binding protein FtsE [Candidatus Enterovibrio altilux]|uniref:Cell division ATP-binding protein FtsE n=1 Tax=Candidatus Enterovibrio altilux TaxID=1927128 RepID=A0A291B942_9GAMM|nr:cell division ATP-binding protein FtsE [Candidatus Enterovibrio luxaltus]ATF09502.1 Cell division transporter, ATP-binding protein FtsE [Candidatus Enterovibrio luxaltus]
MIQFQQVSKVYSGGQQALQKVNFHLPKGDMAFLTGHSGAGKSTLLKLLCAIERPNDGQILFNGHDITKMNRKEIPFLRRHIGIIFQDYQLLTDRSVFDNVALPLRIEQADEFHVKKRVSVALDRVGILDKIACFPTQLSGGEQQRVGIARAVVNQPQVLLSDESSGNCDITLSAQIMELFCQFNQAGVTVLMATNDTSLLYRYDMRRFDLNGGHLFEVPLHD